MNELINFLEKFNILKQTKEQFLINELLNKACSIKKAILKSNTISLECETNSDLANIRKELLDDIKQFQNSIIESVLSIEDDSENANYATIKDFNSAKEELAELTTQEKDLNIYDNDNNSGFLILEEIPELKKHKETLNIVKESCEKNKYTVLMIGEYQSGKTTMLEAICEGRHINAIGTGSATSAVPVYVSYSEEDSFDIEWKSKERLKQLFTHLIEEFDDFIYQEFDLDNEETRNTWLLKFEDLRNSNSCPRNIKQIAICSLLLKYYKTNELDEFVNNITNSHIPSITKFPNNFENRWKEFGSDNFNIEESLFIFVEQVNYYCPSTVLKYLNCTFIDCPGLFNNSYDTEITNRILANVNAIIYILPYNKAFGENVSDSLHEIKNNYKDIHRKLFIVQNISHKLDNNFLGNNCVLIKNMFGEKEYITYDAHLAYIGQTLYSYNHNLLSEADICHFCKPVVKINPITKHETKIEFKDFEEAFKYHIKGYLDIIESSEFPPKTEVIINTSNFNNLITELQEFINENEAYSIIVGEGVDKLSSELTSLRTTLYTSYIEPYFAGKEKTELLWQNRLNKAEVFQTAVSNIKDKILFGNDNNREKLSTRLTEEVYKKLFTKGFYYEIFDTISDTIYDNRTKITTYMGIRGFDKQAYKNFITPLINDNIFKLINSRIIYWHNILQNGQDQDFVNFFTPRMKELEVTLKDEWRELFNDNDNKNFQLHNYISLYSHIEDYYKEVNNNIGQSYGRFGSTFSQIAVPASILAEIGVIVGSIATIVSTVVAIAMAVGLINPLGWIALLAGGVATATLIAIKGKEWVRKEFKNLFIGELIETFDKENIYSKFYNMIEIQITAILEKCNEKISLNIEKMKMERDIATSLSEEDCENNCIQAVDITNTINQQLKKYKEFKEKHVIYGKA